MEALNQDLLSLQAIALAPSSKKTYLQGQQAYHKFCDDFGLQPYPLSELNLRLFSAFLARSLSLATINTYLSAVRLQNIELGFDPNNDMPLLRLLLRGIKRAKGASARDKRQPITVEILKHIKQNIRVSNLSPKDQLMLWSACTTAFFGFLRASEFCSSSRESYNPSSTLLVKDVSIYPNVLVVNIKMSKTDQSREGHQIRLAPSGSSVCPYRALSKHLRNCTAPNNPLFMFENKFFLTRQVFSDQIKQFLPASCDASCFSSHSFRIGAATSAASANSPDWLIKTLGRWSSSCYHRYIRGPTNAIDKFPAQLAKASIS